MNTQALRELVDELLAAEATFGVQTLLDQLQAQLEQLASNPQSQDVQIAYANTLDRLNDVIVQMRTTFSPAKQKTAHEIGGDQFLLPNLSQELREVTASNPLTPAVISTHLGKIIKTRAAFLDTLTQLQKQLQRLGITAPTPDAGTAEIGVLIPRPLFHNHLDEFAKELSVLNNIIRIFSEIATGTFRPVEVHQISTTDPKIFLGIDVETITLIGGAVTWALATLTSILTLRTLREQSVKAKVFTDEEIAQMFDAKAKQLVDTAIQEKTKEILASAHKDSRKHEIESGLAWALESIFAKVERGMTVELRFLPPPAAEAPTPEDTKTERNFQQLKQISEDLNFPEVNPTPILQIPAPEPPQAKPTRTTKS